MPDVSSVVAAIERFCGEMRVQGVTITGFAVASVAEELALLGLASGRDVPRDVRPRLEIMGLRVSVDDPSRR